MEERQFQKEYGSVLERIKHRRGDCPDVELLLAYREGALSPQEKNPLERHLNLCAVCKELVERIGQDAADVDDLSWKRIDKKLDRQEVPWRDAPLRRHLSFLAFRPLTPVAIAVLIGAVAVVWMVRNPDAVSPPEGSAPRGPAIQAIEPAGRAEKVARFVWSAPPVDVTFQLEIRQDDQLIWSDTMPEPTYDVPEPLSRLLKDRVNYRWKVRGVDAAGRLVVESDWTRFEIAAR